MLLSVTEASKGFSSLPAPTPKLIIATVEMVSVFSLKSNIYKIQAEVQTEHEKPLLSVLHIPCCITHGLSRKWFSLSSRKMKTR